MNATLNSNNKMNYELIELKSSKLEDIKQQLKNKFVGIDAVIDQFIESIKTWYIMPQLMTRPLIVNLCGLTGSGKTDLIRTFAKLAQMSSDLMEIQMDLNGSKTLQEILEYSDLSTEKPSIVLLDEFQRFRTKDESGHEIKQTSMQDVWMLLSDGSFNSPSNKKRQIMEFILNDGFYSDNVELDEFGNEVKSEKKNFKYKTSGYSAHFLKKTLNLKDSIEDIMKWDSKTMKENALNALKDESIFEGKSYNQMLIVIAGNIDEAYRISTSVSDSDSDADVFHEQTKHISIVSIKDALNKRFKPEQISRLGNNHIIYTALNKKAYETIIINQINKLCDNAYKQHGVKIVTDNSVLDTIYRNGVFPSQGVRPLFSTFSSIFENYIPDFILQSIKNNINTIFISYDKNNIIAKIGNDCLVKKCELAVDKIKKNIDKNELTAISVHEAGHALVYSLLFNTAPTQIKSQMASDSTSGFVSVHKKIETKDSLKKYLAVGIAGQSAEELVFGDEFKTNGASGDIYSITITAAQYVRQFGFDGKTSYIVANSHQNASILNTDDSDTNTTIEDLLKEAKSKASTLIKQNKILYKEIVEELISNKEISPEKLQAMFKKHGIEIAVKSASEKLVQDFSKKWETFCS